MKRHLTISICGLMASAGLYAATAGATFGQVFQGNQRFGQNQPAGQGRVVGQARTQVIQPQAGQARLQQGTMQYGQPSGQRTVQGQYEQPYDQWDSNQGYRQSQGGLSNQQEIERRLASIEREIRQLRQLLQQQGGSQQNYTQSSDRGFDGRQSDRYDQQYDEEGYQSNVGRSSSGRMQSQDRYGQESYGNRYTSGEGDYRSGSSASSSGRRDTDRSETDGRASTADRRSSNDTDYQRNSSGGRSSRNTDDQSEDYQGSSRSSSGYDRQDGSTSRTGETSTSSRGNSNTTQDD